MSTNKQATIRYLALDKCFRNTAKRYYFSDLLEACNEALIYNDPHSDGIKRRQLYEDIRFMESEAGYGVELDKIRDGKEVYYRYTDPKFSISNRGLNDSEMNQIKSALLVLSRFQGMPQFEWIEEMVAKFESSLGIKEGTQKIIGFDENLDYTAVRNISPLFNAIYYKRALKITYRDFKADKEYEIEFHPYYLKQYNNRWFCFGRNPEKNEITNLALDRILRIREVRTRYLQNEGIDFSEYFEDVIGVTVKGPTYNVLVRIDLDLWPYVLTKPFHGTQKLVNKTSDSVIISIQVKLNYELQSLLLSHGERIEVLEPSVLRKELASRIKKLNRYQR